MKIKISMRIGFLVGMVAIIFLSAAVPMPSSGNFADTKDKFDLVEFKVVNRSSSMAYLWLDGPTFYYFVVKPGETKSYTVMRGEYSKDVKYCGASDSSTIDLTRQTTLVMPVCGANTRHTPSSPNVVDITNTLKIVKVTVTNDASTQVLAILTGPSTYVFLLDRGVSKDYTIAKGDYNVQYFACSASTEKEWSAYFNSVLKLKCP